MSEPKSGIKSECCGAGIYTELDEHQVKSEYNFRYGNRQMFYLSRCMKCDKPCKVKEERDEE